MTDTDITWAECHNIVFFFSRLKKIKLWQNTQHKIYHFNYFYLDWVPQYCLFFPRLKKIKLWQNTHSIKFTTLFLSVQLRGEKDLHVVMQPSAPSISAHWCVRVKWLQLCPTLCDPMDLSPPGSSVRGILQARILQWVAKPFSRGSSPPRDWTWVSYSSCIGRQGFLFFFFFFFTTSATWEALE